MGSACVRGDSGDDYIPPAGTSITTKQVESHQDDSAKSNAMSFENYKSFKFIKNIKEHYTIGKELGSGSFGSVYMTEHNQTKVPAAIKVIKKAKLKENEVYMDLMRNELTVLEKTDHPHIVRVFEILEDKNHFYVVMEFMSGGDLMGKVEKIKQFSEDHAAMILHQVLLALNYMHAKQVSHRDLKPDNLMVLEGENPEDIMIKLTDFGFACFFDPNQKMDVIVGTPIYMSPELVEGYEYDCRVDVWSLGVIAHILLTGQPPFDGKDTDEIRDEILNKQLSFSGSLWCRCSNQAADFVKQCLKRDVRDRPNVDQLFEHPWMKKWISNPIVKAEKQLQIGENILAFRNQSAMQSGVLSLMSNLMASNGELNDYIKMFEKLDTSHDGHISIEEMKKGLKNVGDMYSQVQSEAEWDEILAAMDSNGDGQIDFNEFLAAAYDRTKLLTEKNIRIAFDMFDTKKKGYITMAGLKTVFGTTQCADAKYNESWSTILKEYDNDGDGKISYEEFKAAMQKAMLNDPQAKPQE